MDKIALYKLTAPFVDCNLSLHDTIGAFFSMDTVINTFWNTSIKFQILLKKYRKINDL